MGTSQVVMLVLKSLETEPIVITLESSMARPPGVSHRRFCNFCDLE